MENSNQQSGENNKGSEGANNTPPATPPNNNPPATDELVQISKKELEGLRKSNKDLTSQRDRNDAEIKNRLSYVDLLAMREDIGTFLKDNADKYPDVTVQDLEGIIASPDDIEPQAKALQERYEKIIQNRLQKIESTPQPQLTTEQRAEQEKELKKEPKSGNFGKMLRLRSKQRA